MDNSDHNIYFGDIENNHEHGVLLKRISDITPTEIIYNLYSKDSEQHMHMKSTRAGLVCTICAVTIWSTAAMLIRMGGANLPKWQMLGMATGIATISQFALRAFLRRPLRNAVIFPPRVIFAFLVPFVATGFLFPLAVLMSKSPSHALVATLLNYLWPTMTVVFGVMFIPAMKFSKRIIAGVAISIAALLIANLPALTHFNEITQAWPAYTMGFFAAVVWGIYSALMVKWRDLMHRYSVVPLGFLIQAVIFLIIAAVLNQWQSVNTKDLLLVVALGVGPFGLGYYLWELAGTKGASSTAMGMWGAIVPIGATIGMAIADRTFPAWYIYPAAAMMSLAAIVIRQKPTRVTQT